MPIDPNPCNRHSIRMKDYDYASPGAYFVTVVTYERRCLFGEVVNGKVKLSVLGEIALHEWFQTSILRPYVDAYQEEFVVMPNHIHGIIWINWKNHDGRGAASLRPYMAKERPIEKRPCVFSQSLGAIVRSYKSAVTYKINAMRNRRALPVWQRNYYEHIIRDEVEWNNIYQYIQNNPEHWLDDPENTQ